MTHAAPTPVNPNKAKPLTRVMVIALLAIVVIGGATIWWIGHKAHPAKDQAEAFIHDLVAGNLDAARARCTPSVDFDAMARLADPKTGKMRFWGPMKDASLIVVARGDRADVDGTLAFTSEELRKAFSATLVKQPDGTWKITTFGFN